MTDAAMLTQESGYVGMTRGRWEDRIYGLITIESAGQPNISEALKDMSRRFDRRSRKDASVDVGEAIPRQEKVERHTAQPQRPGTKNVETDEIDLRIAKDVARMTGLNQRT